MRSFFALFKFVKHIVEPDMSSYDPSCEIDHSLLKNCKPHHREAVELAMRDLYGRRMEAIIRLPAPVERWICDTLLNDARDLRLFLTFMQVTLWLGFSSYVQLVLLPKDTRWSYLWLAPHMVITWVILGQRFILAMHYAAHRPLFKPSLGLVASALNAFPLTILSNFYGMPCGAYYLHHCIMHHQASAA